MFACASDSHAGPPPRLARKPVGGRRGETDRIRRNREEREHGKGEGDEGQGGAGHGRRVGHRARHRRSGCSRPAGRSRSLDRDETALAASPPSSASRSGVFTSTLDVTDEAAAEKAVAMAAEALGGIDGVVNSAGIAADIPALDTPVDLFRKILDVNVVGTFIVARAAARVMKDTRRRRHRQHQLGLRRARQQGTQRLRRVEGRRGRADPGAGQRPRPLRHPRERGGAGPGRHADGAGACTASKDRALWARHIPMRRYAKPDEIASVIEFLLDGTQSSYRDRRDRGRRRRLPRRRRHRGVIEHTSSRIEADCEPIATVRSFGQSRDLTHSDAHN